MTRQDFVRRVKVYALDNAVTDTMQDLQDPPGRVPSPSLVAAHKWFTELDESSRQMVEQVARMAAESAAFGVLAILDHVRGVDGRDKGQLILEYRNAGQTVRLNDFNDELLHDLLAALFDFRSSPNNPPALDLQHVPQCNIAMKMLAGYTPDTGTCIALTTRDHKNISRESSRACDNIQAQVAKDLQDLRDFTNTPDSAIDKLSAIIPGIQAKPRKQ
jgi:hypothetical protein